MWELIEETLLDSIKMLPFLIIAYLVIESISRGTGKRMERFIGKLGVLGPIGGGVLGLIPQCGVSVMAANFYNERMISIGTLMAVFLATSDEAIPVLLANPGNGKLILQLLGIKAALAVIAGIFIDFCMRCFRKGGPSEEGQFYGEKSQTDQCRDFREVYSHKHSCGCGCDHHDHCQGNIFLAALKHAMKVFLFILGILFVLNVGMTFLGQETVAELLMKDSIFQPFIAGLFGMVPNCASSVILTQLYLEGSLSLGAVVAGLSAGTGVGLAVLVQISGSKKESLLIAAGLYGIGVLAGVAIGLAGW